MPRDLRAPNISVNPSAQDRSDFGQDVIKNRRGDPLNSVPTARSDIDRPGLITADHAGCPQPRTIQRNGETCCAGKVPASRDR